MSVQRNMAFHVEDGQVARGVADSQQLPVRPPHERRRLAVLAWWACRPKLRKEIEKVHICPQKIQQQMTEFVITSKGNCFKYDSI